MWAFRYTSEACMSSIINKRARIIPNANSLVRQSDTDSYRYVEDLPLVQGICFDKLNMTPIIQSPFRGLGQNETYPLPPKGGDCSKQNNCISNYIILTVFLHHYDRNRFRIKRAVGQPYEKA